jgi:hypothetical protein
MDIAPVVNSYYENFLELLAQILSRAVTTKEQEAILKGLRDFQEKLRRLSRYIIFTPAYASHGTKPVTKPIPSFFSLFLSL